VCVLRARVCRSNDVRGRCSLHQEEWEGVSAGAVGVVRTVLVADATLRPGEQRYITNKQEIGRYTHKIRTVRTRGISQGGLLSVHVRCGGAASPPAGRPSSEHP
jgi:hypothetical protein